MYTPHFHLDIWTVLALIVVAVMIVIAVIHTVNQRNREKDFQEQLREKLNAENPASGENIP